MYFMFMNSSNITICTSFIWTAFTVGSIWNKDKWMCSTFVFTLC